MLVSGGSVTMQFPVTFMPLTEELETAQERQGGVSCVRGVLMGSSCGGHNNCVCDSWKRAKQEWNQAKQEWSMVAGGTEQPPP